MVRELHVRALRLCVFEVCLSIEGDRKQYEHLKSEVVRLEKMLKEKNLKEKEESKSAGSGDDVDGDHRSIGSEHLTDEDVNFEFLLTLIIFSQIG